MFLSPGPALSMRLPNQAPTSHPETLREAWNGFLRMRSALLHGIVSSALCFLFSQYADNFPPFLLLALQSFGSTTVKFYFSHLTLVSVVQWSMFGGGESFLS